MADPNKPPQSRLDRELQEILERVDRETTAAEKVRSNTSQFKHNAPAQIATHGQRLAGFLAGPGGWIAVFALAISARFVDDWSPAASKALAIASVMVLVAMIVLPNLRRRGGEQVGSSPPKLPSTGTDWSHRLRNRDDSSRR